MHKKSYRLITSPVRAVKGGLLAAACVFFLFAVHRPVMAAHDSYGSGFPEVFPAEEVVSGLRGVGRTSFQGEELQEFEFEVLGVLRSFHPQGRIILVELEHSVLEHSGVIAGMSGSPLFVDGRLLGAVAYGFTQSLKPIAGVTPAEEMQIPFDMVRSGRSGTTAPAAKARAREYVHRRAGRILEGAPASRADSGALRRELLEAFISAPWQSAGARQDGVRVEGWEGMAPEVEAGLPDSRLRPLPMPLSFSGVDISGLKGLKPIMQAGGMMAVQAPQAPSPDSVARDSDLEPGRPVGVVLMKGDIDIAGMGTLTFIDGETVAAFGHPMTGAGDTDLPLALGHVEAIVPSRFMSFRLTSSRQIIGSVIQDRASAIVGVIGRQAPMFPARVDIGGVHDATYNYRLAGHWQFAPMMSLYAAALSVMRWEGADEMMTVEATSRLKLKGYDEPLILRNVYSGFDPVRPAFELVMMPVQSLMLNPFEEVHIESLDVSFQVEKGINAAAIESVRLERNEIRPGEKLRMWVTLRPYHGPARVEEIGLTIPEDAEPGRVVDIDVLDAAAVMSLTFDKDPGLLRPQSMDGLLESLRVVPQNTHLFVRGDFVRRGLRYNEEPMPALPGSVRNMLEYGTISGRTTPLIEDVMNSVETPWVVEGARTVRVKIMK